MNQKRIGYQRKLRIRKQSTSTSPIKPIILLKLLGTITIDNCNIVVHVYSLFGPWRVLTGYKKAIEGFGTQFQHRGAPCSPVQPTGLHILSSIINAYYKICLFTTRYKTGMVDCQFLWRYHWVRSVCHGQNGDGESSTLYVLQQYKIKFT